MDIETNIEIEEFQTGGVTVVSTAHAVHDTYTSFLPALLPVLIEKFTLTNTMAGLLSVFLQSPSLLQPVIGHLADRVNLKWLIILTPAVTGSAMSLLGIAPNYGFLVFFVVLAGVSSAALHAVGPVVGSTFSGARLGKGMGFWMVGGELGRALGPLITVTAIGYFTLEGLPWLMLGGILVSVFLFEKLKKISTLTHTETNQLHWKIGLQKMRKVMVPLAIVLFARAMLIASLTIYLPTFLSIEGASLWMAGMSLTILQISGVIGALLAGGLSDKLGRRKLLVISYVSTPILMFLFMQTNNFLQFPFLILLGFSAISVTPVVMAIVLESFPDNRSFANGVYMAIIFVLSGLATLLVGVLGDLVDLRFTFYISAALLPLGLPFIRLLPKSHH